MRYQQRPYSCGAAAIVNAMRCFGKRVPEKLVRIRAGTTKKDGTQEGPMKAALRSFGFEGTKTFEDETARDAFSSLSTYVDTGRPVIICVQNDQHWVTVIGSIGNDKGTIKTLRYIVIDPARTLYNKEENGIRMMNKRQLSEFWKNKKGKYTGIVVQTLP